METYARIARRLGRELERPDRAREAALAHAREAGRLAARLIHGLQRSRWDASDARALEREARALRVLARRHPFLAHHGAVVQGLGEYVEAHLLRAFLHEVAPPGPRRLAVPPAAYLHGLADFVGELRRVVLSRLLAGDLGRAGRAFETIEKVYEALMDSRVPESLVPLRPKLDAARALLERTRGELLTAKKTKDLERKIDSVARLLDEAEGRAPEKARRKDPNDLDLDAAWNRE